METTIRTAKNVRYATKNFSSFNNVILLASSINGEPRYIYMV